MDPQCGQRAIPGLITLRLASAYEVNLAAKPFAAIDQ